MKKIHLHLCLFFLLVFLSSAMVTTASAEDPGEARIGDTYYATLEAAVEAANTGDTVVIVSDVVLDATLIVDQGITITTDGVTHRTITGTPSSNNYYINVKTTASTISGVGPNSRLIIDGQNTSHSRALICLQAAGSHMEYVTLQNNISTYSGGGGLYTNKTDITLDYCIIENNTCTGATGGGGIYLTGAAAVTMNSCTVTGNTATASGGGAFVATGGSLTMHYCTISNNTAAVRGGAVKANGNFLPKNCIITGNKASSFGGTTLLSSLPTFDGTLAGRVDGSDGQEEAVYRTKVSGDTYATYAAKLTAAGYTLRRSTQIDNNTFGVFTNNSYTVTLMDTPTVDGGTVRILIENTAVLPTLHSASGTPIVTPSVTMLGCGDSSRQNGMSYLYQLSDGRFIVVDGGYVDDADQLYNAMKALSGDREIVIAAWFLSHAHNDHVAAFVTFWGSQYAGNITLEKVVYNFPADETFADHIVDGAASTTWRDRTLAVIEALPSSTERIKAHPGQIYTLGDSTITMLYTAELMAPDELWNFNDTSLVFKLELGGVELLQLADCAKACGEVLTAAYSNALACDVLQVAHHGYYNNCVDTELYQAADPSYALWNCTLERYTRDKTRTAAANVWLFNQASLGNIAMWCAADDILTFQLSNNAMSSTPVAKIGSTGYATLAEAISAASEGDTITLTRSIATRDSGVAVNKSITLYADNPCAIYGSLAVSNGATLTLSGSVTIDQITLSDSARIGLSGTLPENCATLSVGDFSAVESAASAGTVYLTGDVPANYQKFTLANNTNGSSAYMLYANGKIVAAGEARIGSVTFTTLEEAVAAASSGATVTLISDAHLEDQLRIEKSMTLATDGYSNRTITSDYIAGYMVFVTGASGSTISVTLQGSDSARLILNGENVTRDKSLLCCNYASSTLRYVTVENGATDFTGAGVYITQGSTNMTNCILGGNATSSKGGAVYITSTGSVSMTGGIIRDNSASYGGAIFGTYSSTSGRAAAITLNSVTLEDNTAANRGGAIYGNGNGTVCTSVTVNDCTFTRNLATTASNGAGGAICMVGSQADLTVSTSTFCNNQAASFGGAIAASSSGGHVTLVGCTFTNNTAGGSSLGGGAVCSGSLTISGGITTMTGNTASTSNGGAICLQGTTLTIAADGVLGVSGNTAPNGLGRDIHMAANGCIALVGTVNGSVNLSVADATVGDAVLTGSGVASQYTVFTFGDGSFSISSAGILTAA